jgi:hypothetical protein
MFWMMSVGTEDGSGRLAYRWLSRNRPSVSLEAPTAKLEIGEEKSLRRNRGCRAKGKPLKWP